MRVRLSWSRLRGCGYYELGSRYLQHRSRRQFPGDFGTICAAAAPTITPSLCSRPASGRVRSRRKTPLLHSRSLSTAVGQAFHTSRPHSNSAAEALAQDSFSDDGDVVEDTRSVITDGINGQTSHDISSPRFEAAAAVAKSQVPETEQVSYEAERVSVEENFRNMAQHAFDAPISSRVYSPMLKTIRTARGLGLPDKTPGYLAETTQRPKKAARKSHGGTLERQSMDMARKLAEKRRDPAWVAKLKQRAELPVMANKLHAQLMQTLNVCDVLIVPGSTGSGKTTQVPQIILDYAIQEGRGAYTNVICAQPRRISAVSVARRVASERCESLGETVGHHVRFSLNRPRKHGFILYCTGGILWTYLHHRPDDIMDNTSHILIDEVHERSIDIDMKLMMLRELIHQRKANGQPYPKLIIMSATLQRNDLLDYFAQPSNGLPGLRTSVFEIPGRMHPVTETYLNGLVLQLLRSTQQVVSELMRERETEEYVRDELNSTEAATTEQIVQDSIVTPHLTAAAIIHIFSTTGSGDILVFLPGMQDIEKTAQLLEDNATALKSPLFAYTAPKIFKLHSLLNETNDGVFAELPQGQRRIILSSNIAETSITLPGVEHVIDTGTVKISVLDRDSGTRGLVCQWASKQSVQQRRGRAGRLRPGHYYGLYSEARLDVLQDHVTPEIRRVDLMGTALSMRVMANPMDIRTGLGSALDPPDPDNITSAIQGLTTIGALTNDEQVTPLGRVLSVFAASPIAAKAVLLGVLFRCLEPMVIAATADEGDPLDHRVREGSALLRSRYNFAQGSESNAIGLYNAFKAMHEAVSTDDKAQEDYLISECGLRRDLYHYMARSARQICEHLNDHGLALMPDLGTGLYPNIPAEFNVNSGCIPLVKTLLMLSSQPELGVRWSKNTFFSNQGLMMPAPRTVNNAVSSVLQRERIGARVAQKGDLCAYGFGRFIPDGQRMTMVDSTMVTPLMAILCAREVSRINDSQVMVNGSINLKIEGNDVGHKMKTSDALTLTIEFRKLLHRFLQVSFSDLGAGVESAGTNKMFAKENKLRDEITAGLIDMLEKDAEAERVMLDERYLAWSEFDAKKQERVVQDGPISKKHQKKILKKLSRTGVSSLSTSPSRSNTNVLDLLSVQRGLRANARDGKELCPEEKKTTSES